MGNASDREMDFGSFDDRLYYDNGVGSMEISTISVTHDGFHFGTTSTRSSQYDFRLRDFESEMTLRLCEVDSVSTWRTYNISSIMTR